MCFNHDKDGRVIRESGRTISVILSKMGLFEPHLSLARDRGFDRACALLTKETLSDIENRLLTAIRWAGQAGVNKALKSEYHEKLDTDREQSFLFYAICLESLFCNRVETEKITEILSQRCAHLLGDDATDRENIRKEVKKLYDRRSDIVHQGDFQVSAQELNDIRVFACSSIIKILTAPEWLTLKDDNVFIQRLSK